jgi:multidrug efflux system outer membrane protein
MKVQIALLGALLGVSGCMVGPDYKRPEVSLPAAFPESAPPKAATGAALRADWWTLYEDKALDELVASAMERNADVRLAVARIEEAAANLRAANAAYFPEVDLLGNANRTLYSTTTALPVPPGVPALRNDVRLAPTTSFEIDFWGKLRRGVEGFRAQYLSTRYARDVVLLTLAGSTAQTYFTLRMLDAQIAVSRESVANRQESLGFVRRRVEGGIATALELAQAEGALADIASQLKDQERQRALAEHLLGTLTGRLDLKLVAGDLRKLPSPPLPPPGLPSSLLDRRPDIRQAEQDLVNANAQIGVAKSALFPSISLTGFLGSESAGLSTLMRTGGAIWSLGFGLSLPIFDAGRYQARTDAAVARQRQALAGYQKSIETGFREVADALVNLRQLSDAEADFEMRAGAARNAVRLSQLRYEAGYSPYLEVLDAQRNANDAESALLRNRQAVLASSVDLMKALGGGWTPQP